MVEGLNHAMATVIRVEPPYLWVQTERKGGGCSGCHAQSACGTSTLAKLFTKERSEPLKVLNAVESTVSVGDLVVLELKESDLIQHSLMAYGVPLFGLFLGALSFQWIQRFWQFEGWLGSELFTVLGGMVTMLLGWWGVKRWYRPCLPIAKKLRSLHE